MLRATSMVRYGNPFGMPSEDVAFPLLRVMRNQSGQATSPEPTATPEQIVKPEPARNPKTPTKRDRSGVVINVEFGRYNFDPENKAAVTDKYAQANYLIS